MGKIIDRWMSNFENDHTLWWLSRIQYYLGQESKSKQPDEAVERIPQKYKYLHCKPSSYERSP